MIPQRLQPSITEELEIAENVSSKFHREGKGNEIEIMMETSKLSPELFPRAFCEAVIPQESEMNVISSPPTRLSFASKTIHTHPRIVDNSARTLVDIAKGRDNRCEGARAERSSELHVSSVRRGP
jgi:hypothetical protein